MLSESFQVTSGNKSCLEELMKQSTSLFSATFHKEEVFIDIPFNNNKVEYAVNKLKMKKSACWP